MTDRQLADYRRYEHIIHAEIKKHAPELIGDEDFMQDCYLHFIKTITSPALSKLEKQSDRATRIYTNMAQYVTDHADKHHKNVQNADICNLVPSYAMQHTEVHIDIMSALNALSEIQREVVVLHFGLNGEPAMTFAEIADTLGISLGRVHTIERMAFRNIRASNSALHAYL